MKRNKEREKKRNINFFSFVIFSLYALKNWPEMFQNREILVRLDPGKGEGHHKCKKTNMNQQTKSTNKTNQT